MIKIQIISIVSSQPQKHDDFLNIISTAHKGNKPERDVHYEEGLAGDYEKRRKQMRLIFLSLLNVMNMIVSRSFKTIPFKCSSIWVKGVCHCLLPFISSALTKGEIKAQAFLFFAAGYDTTANALCWLI